METISLSFKDQHAIVELNRPKANAVNIEMIQELRETFASLANADHVRGVILTGQGTIFSAGIDVIEVLGYDEKKLTRYWDEFCHLCRDMVGFPKPMVAAINGHGPAAGCVFAMCCDYRIMVEGNFRIGLNEVPVGIVVPRPIVELARYAVGDAKASLMFLNGMLMPPQQAREFGLVDDVCPATELMTRAELKLESWLAMSEDAWKDAKHRMRRPLLERMDMDLAEAIGETVRCILSPQGRANLGKLVERLAQKKK